MRVMTELRPTRSWPDRVRCEDAPRGIAPGIGSRAYWGPAITYSRVISAGGRGNRGTAGRSAAGVGIVRHPPRRGRRRPGVGRRDVRGSGHRQVAARSGAACDRSCAGFPGALRDRLPVPGRPVLRPDARGAPPVGRERRPGSRAPGGRPRRPRPALPRAPATPADLARRPEPGADAAVRGRLPDAAAGGRPTAASTADRRCALGGPELARPAPLPRPQPCRTPLPDRADPPLERHRLRAAVRAGHPAPRRLSR